MNNINQIFEEMKKREIIEDELMLNLDQNPTLAVKFKKVLKSVKGDSLFFVSEESISSLIRDYYENKSEGMSSEKAFWATLWNDNRHSWKTTDRKRIDDIINDVWYSDVSKRVAFLQFKKEYARALNISYYLIVLVSLAVTDYFVITWLQEQSWLLKLYAVVFSNVFIWMLFWMIGFMSLMTKTEKF